MMMATHRHRMTLCFEQGMTQQDAKKVEYALQLLTPFMVPSRHCKRDKANIFTSVVSLAGPSPIQGSKLVQIPAKPPAEKNHSGADTDFSGADTRLSDEKVVP
jgi:hypothetical protein